MHRKKVIITSLIFLILISTILVFYFLNRNPKTTIDTKAQDIFFALKEKYPYLYSFNNNGQLFIPMTQYRIYNFEDRTVYLAFSEYKLPSWSGISVVILGESTNGYEELLAVPYTNNRGRWQELLVENLGRTVKITGDVGKIGCNGVDCRIKWFDYYNYNSESQSYQIANSKYNEEYKQLLAEYEEINKNTCITDTDGKINESLLSLLPKKTPSDSNFCDEHYGTKLLEYNDIKNFAQAYTVIENIISGKNESYFK